MLCWLLLQSVVAISLDEGCHGQALEVSVEISCYLTTRMGERELMEKGLGVDA
jgi:hypothetical protein